ncbi:MAG: phosphate acyltransferase PlsX [Chitinophagaceae bacterium]|nr:phosphate acyltransferase PlsX [Chitinophagaceae bacterium]MCB9046319.1 phosphate acyltransferase PlsX [Chitinophagales bacterium]
MKIAFDIMGGDYAPSEALKGVQLFLDENQDQSVHLLLIGTPDTKVACNELLSSAYKGRYTYVDAPQVIGMDEHPTKALKEKQQSSIAIGFGMLQAKKADAFISAGNTGAMMVGAMYTVKNIPGVQRPTIASPVPRIDGAFNLLLDVGINADCKPENLLQFAQLGSMYMKHVMGVENPKVGLLNIGEEEGKGNILAQATYPLLKANKDLNFVGNIEGRDIFTTKADIIVCEGFVGNVILKLSESLYHLLIEQRKIQDEFLDTFNHEIYGGTPILGINDTVIIGHGVSHALAFKNMIEVASRNIKVNLQEKLKNYFSPEEEQA